MAKWEARKRSGEEGAAVAKGRTGEGERAGGDQRTTEDLAMLGLCDLGLHGVGRGQPRKDLAQQISGSQCSEERTERGILGKLAKMEPM